MAHEDDLRWRVERERMVEEQIRARGIRDERVLEAMRTVPRHAFVPPRLASAAYEDHPLPLGHGQTISQPYIVALMLAAARVGPEATLLDIGTGSGYAAAVASRLAGRVISIERIPDLAASAAARLAEHGFPVTVITADAGAGWPEEAPYDVIASAAATPAVPHPWVDQLAVSGRVVVPVGASRFGQRLVALTKLAGDRTREEDLGAVSFVELVTDTP